MDRNRPRQLLGVLIPIVGLASACGGPVPVAKLPTSRETLISAGKRLSETRSAAELSTLTPRGDLVLAALSPDERDALGRGYLRFQVDRTVIVEVAAPRHSIPFWLADQGFAATDRTINVLGERWPLYSRTFESGTVGLGVNGLDRSPLAHYAAFVRSKDGKAPMVKGIEPSDWKVAVANVGVSTTFDVELPIRSLPDDLRGSWLFQPSREWRNATTLARAGRAWKTHVVSKTAPDQVAIAFGADPARGLSWTWRTSPEVSSSALRIAPAAKAGSGPADPGAVRVIKGESTRVESPDLLNDPVVLRHRVRVDDLAPDTTYAYALGDGSPTGWSPWRTVRTGPATPRSFRFLYLGDAQCGLEGWGKLLHSAQRRNPDAAFLLLAGDLVDRGNERTNWDHFFLRAEGVFDTLPLMPCVGNHEYLDRGPWLYSTFFDLPRNGPAGIAPPLVYSFEYANAFVAVLDSTPATVDRGVARLQAEWLEAALAKTRAAWKFVMFHHPIYASHQTREYPTLGEDWVTVFDKHHVDMVLQGHDHAYLRTFPMRSGRKVASNAEGTTYVVSVSGEKFCEQATRDYTTVGFTNVSTYQTIDIDVPSSRLIYRAWDIEGHELDRLMIQKPETLAQH